MGRDTPAESTARCRDEIHRVSMSEATNVEDVKYVKPQLSGAIYGDLAGDYVHI